MEGFSAGEFLQGFLEEASEHLQNINQRLLRLEQILLPGVEPADSAAIERVELLSELFRSFHTLKGLASMVGLAEAARLSHALETALQAVQKDELPLNQRLVDRLFSGTRTLTELVDTLRDTQRTAPDIRADLQAMDELMGRTPEPGSTAEDETVEGLVEEILPGLATYPEMLDSLGELEQGKIRAAARAGQKFMLVIFTSSAERAAHGENVDRMRQEIQTAGTVIKAAPMLAGGQMRFLFLVSAPRALEANSTIADEVIPLVVRPIQAVEKGPAVPATANSATAEPAPTVPASVSGPARAYASDGAQPLAVRVDLARLDELMRYAGDLIQLRSRLGIGLARLDDAGRGPASHGGAAEAAAVRRDLQQTYLQLGRTLRGLNRAILRARMVPLAETFNHMPLVVRDLARASQKEVRLEIQGETTEVDKLLVERLLDPLIHLVRNAIIHGIEPPEARIARGKPERGTLILRGIPEGDHILVEVRDDGAGVNLEAIAARAAEMGWRQSTSPLEADEALEIISRPGFTTQVRADLSAGRGVGLDVVQRVVRSFGGQLSMETSPGQGTSFRMRLPLTLVIVDVFIARVGGERYAIPRGAVERVVEMDPAGLVRVEGGELYQDRDVFYVVYPLSRLVRLPDLPAPDSPTRSNGARRNPVGLVVSVEESGAARGSIRARDSGRPILVVDQVQELHEVVVHTVTDPLVAQPGVGGAAELGDGSVILILDIPALLRQARRG